jgi:hypothetical protein
MIYFAGYIVWAWANFDGIIYGNIYIEGGYIENDVAVHG